MRRLLHDYLGGPTKFTKYNAGIGDSTILHGEIGLTIFVKAADAAKGFFSINRSNIDKVATGVNLGPIGILANKGMAGLSARYFDCSLAFVTAHFASDSKGRNRLRRRNRVS